MSTKQVNRAKKSLLQKMSDGYTKQPRAKNVFSLVTRGNQVQGMKPHCQQHAVLFSSPFVADMLCDLLGAIHWIPQVSQ